MNKEELQAIKYRLLWYGTSPHPKAVDVKMVQELLDALEAAYKDIEQCQCQCKKRRGNE